MANIKCSKCGSLIGNVTPGSIVKCPRCGHAMRLAAPNSANIQNVQYQEVGTQAATPKQIVTPKGNSALGILALIFSILGCTFWIGAILAIVDLCQRNGRKKTCSIISMVICGVWLIIAVGMSMSSQSVSTHTGTTNRRSLSADTEDELFKVGQTAELNNVQVTMKSYKESAGSAFNEPSDGNIFLLVEFEIMNYSDSDLTISSILSFDAYADNYSINESVSAMLESESGQLDGSIAPGKGMRGYIGYEVASDWKNIEIHFTDNVWSNNKFKFVIER